MSLLQRVTSDNNQLNVAADRQLTARRLLNIYTLYFFNIVSNFKKSSRDLREGKLSSLRLKRTEKERSFDFSP